MLDKGKVAAAAPGKAGEKRLIDPAAETQRAGRDAGLALAGDMPGDLLRIDQANIGQAIGQQDRAAKPSGRAELGAGEMLTAELPAAEQVGRAARFDRP